MKSCRRAGRRSFVAGVVLGALGLACWRRAAAHTPYRQWVVYRKKHLIIGTCRADPDSYPFGKDVARVLAAELPESKARVARAPDQRRLASLITTGQLEVVLLRHEEGRQLLAGEPPFEDYGPFDVLVVFEFEDYLLLASADMPDYHAWLVARTLAEAEGRAPILAAERLSVPVHPGTAAVMAGRTVPPEPPAPEPAAAQDHVH